MKAEFIQRVMQIMNELGWDNTESNAFIGSDTTKIEGHIEAVFVDAWRKAINILPKTYFTIKDFSDQRFISDTSTGTGYIVLPDDFYMLFSFQINGWKKSVESLYDNSDSIASIQANEYTRGNICRPVCIKNKRTISRNVGANTIYEIKDTLDYYSLPKGLSHTITKALYIPLISPLSNDTNLDDKLYVPLAYLCASTVFYIFEKYDIAKVLESKAVEIYK